MSIKWAAIVEILISFLSGSIYDVIGDLRKGSSIIDMWDILKLSTNNEKSVWINEVFVHAFLPLKFKKSILYKLPDYWIKNYVRSINLNNKFIKIDWDINFFKISKIIFRKTDQDDSSSLEIFENEVLG